MVERKGIMGHCNCVICHAWPGDISAIREMQRQSMKALAAGRYSDEEISAYLAGHLPDVARAIAEGRYFVAIGMDGGMLGSGGWSSPASNVDRQRPDTRVSTGEAVAQGTFVTPAAARHGIASAIMHRVENDARDEGVRRLSLRATLSSVAFYEALGYTRGKNHEMTLAPGITFGFVEMSKPILPEPASPFCLPGFPFSRLSA
jgi:GNAT superfamily N-acetyltransferase